MSKKLIAGLGVVAGLAVAMAPVATFAAHRNTASDTHTDILKINVPASCSFGSVALNKDGITHTDGNVDGDGEDKVVWIAETNEGEGTVADDKIGLIPDRELRTGETPDPRTRHESIHAFTGAFTIYGGTTEDTVAKTKLLVYCNDASQAYTLTATMGNLTHADNEIVIAPEADYSETKSGYALYSVVADTTNKGTINEKKVSNDGSRKLGETAEAIIATSRTPEDADGTDPIINTEAGDGYTITYGAGVKADQKAGIYKGQVVYNLYQGV